MNQIALVLAALAGLPAAGFTQDLNLSQLSALALKSHPRIQSTSADQEAADARRRLSLAPFRPQISLNGYGAFGNGSMMFQNSVEPGNAAILPPGGAAVANATLMWKVFSFGRDEAVANAGRADVRAAGWQVQSESEDVLLQVRMAFAEALYQRDRQFAFEASLASAEEMERITDARFEAGKVPEAFQLRAKAERARAEGDLAMARADTAAATAALWDAAGMETPPAESEIGTWDVGFGAPASLDAALKLALSKRPELLALEDRRKASAARSSAISKSRLPELSVAAMNDFMGASDAEGQSEFKAGLVLSFPLDDGGRRRAESDEETAASRQIDAAVRSMRDKIASETRSAWAQWEASDSVRKAAEAELKASEEAYRVSLLRYEDGKSILAELIDSRTQVTEARLSLAGANAYQRRAWSRLTRSVGGL